MKRKALRPMGQITQDLEHILQEMTDPDGHDLQNHEVLAQVAAWLAVHAPHALETYTADNTHPVFYYGHRDGLK